MIIQKISSVNTPLLYTVIFLITTYIHLTQELYCKPTRGNITSLSRNNNCACLFDDSSGWVKYEIDKIFQPTTMYKSNSSNSDKIHPSKSVDSRSTASVTIIGNSSFITNNNSYTSTINNSNIRDKEEDLITIEVTVEASSTYAGITSKCQLVYEEDINTDGVDHALMRRKQFLYCPYDVSKNMDRSIRHDITLFVTRTYLRRVVNNADSSDSTNQTDSTYNNFDNTTNSSEDKNNHNSISTNKNVDNSTINNINNTNISNTNDTTNNTNNTNNSTTTFTYNNNANNFTKTIKSTETTTTTTMWASYQLPPIITYCKCNFTQPWSWEMVQWDTIKVKWPKPEAARNYLYNVTSTVQTKVVIKQREKKDLYNNNNNGGNSDGALKKHDVCSDSKTATGFCIIPDITDYVDIRRTFIMCVHTTIASCLNNIQTSCKNITLNADSVLDHFKPSQTSCHHHNHGKDDGDNKRLRVTWETENRVDNKPIELEYSIALLKSKGGIITQKFVPDSHDDSIKDYTFYNYDSDEVASVRIRVCLKTTSTALYSSTSAVPTRQCGNPRLSECTRDDVSLITDTHLILIVVAAVLVITSLAIMCIIFLRKRSEAFSSSGDNRKNTREAIEIDVILNNHDGQCDSSESGYAEVCNDFTIEPETVFDTIDVPIT